MRLKSAIWVSAYLRRCAAAGAYGAITHRGDDSAGAIFVEVLHDGGVDLYGPCLTEEGRRFERLMEDAAPMDVVDRLDRERRFDTDLWVVTIEDRKGRSFLAADEHG